MNIYRPPKARLNATTGIDGTTCPHCRGEVGWVSVYLKALWPNSFKCPGCQARLKFDISSVTVYVWVIVLLLYASGAGFMLQVWLEDGLTSGWLLYFILGLTPIVVVSVGLTWFCRRYRKLVLRG